MKSRTITGLIIAIIYIVALLLSIYVHEIFFDIFVIVVAMMAALEMSKALGRKFGNAIDVVIILHTLFGYIAFKIVHSTIGSQSGGITAYFGVLALMFFVSIIITMASKTLTVRNAVSTMMVMVYPVSVLIYMLGINYLRDYRVSGLIMLFIVSSFTDTCAYLVGSLVKGPKLCPKISPKKTISGAIGGLLGGVLAGALVMLFASFGWFKATALSSVLGFNVMHFLLIGLGGSVFTQAGDLIASYIKRSCDIKDYGNLLPGHGGVLDRIDGLMLNAVFVFCYLTFLTAF